MIKRIFIKITYIIGKNIYNCLRLDRLEITRKVASCLMNHMMTKQYDLHLKLEEFDPSLKSAGKSDWLTLEDVSITGGSRLITKGTNAFLPILQNNNLWKNIKHFKLQEEAQLKFKIKHSTQKIFIRPQDHNAILEDVCFSTLSPFSSSWVHWLFEIFPQLIDLSQSPYQETVKILVETDAPSQIYETISSFFPETNIIKVAPNEHIVCRKLLVNTNIPQSWSVLWGRNVNDKLTETFHHDMDALVKIREAVYKRFNISEKAPQNNVFIRRKALFRFIHNEQELADCLLTKKFSVIEPSAMSFREQVECFSDTNIIVAQSGASLANIIFMKPGSTVICMAAQSAFLNYDYFLSIAEKLGISFLYLLGKVDDEKKYSHKLHLSVHHPLNASFSINKDQLESLLENKLSAL